MAPADGELVTEALKYDGRCPVTAYVPPDPAEAVVFAADGGWHVSHHSEVLETASTAPTMIVGVHGRPDDDERLHEYVPDFDVQRFAAHEKLGRRAGRPTASRSAAPRRLSHRWSDGIANSARRIGGSDAFGALWTVVRRPCARSDFARSSVLNGGGRQVGARATLRWSSVLGASCPQLAVPGRYWRGSS